MKKFLSSFSGALIIAFVFSCFFGPFVGGIALASGFVKKDKANAYITLNREIFIGSLKDAYLEENTWLDNAEDLSQFVDQNQTLKFGEAGANPAVYVNKTDDVDSVEPTEIPNAIDLDTYDSQNYKIRNINLSTLPYNKIEFYTKKSAEAIRLKEALTAAYSFSPTSAGDKKIILPTTGDALGGFKKLTLDDIQKLAEQMDVAKFPKAGRNLVLDPAMWWQLINNNDILKAQMQFQQKIGVIDPTIVNYYGIIIHKYTHEVGYNVNTSTKAALGTAIGGNVVNVGFAFVKNEVFRASGAFNMVYMPFASNTAGRAYEMGFQHRFKAGFQRANEKYSALIYRAPAENI
jgi:hypothetical protein